MQPNKIPLILLVMLMPGLCNAQTAAAGSEQATLVGSGVSVLLAQRFWVARTSTLLLDAVVVLPNGAAGAPEVQEQWAPIKPSGILSLTTVGLRWKDWLVAATVSPRSRSAIPEASGGAVSRSEYDFSVGWSFAPAMTASLIYKYGKADINTTLRAAQLLGVATGTQSGHALLVGLSANAALQSTLALYGNLAWGPGRWKTQFGPVESSAPASYTIGEFGLSWRLAPNVAANLGYRMQEITVRNIELHNYAPTVPPQVTSVRKTSNDSNTAGVIVGLAAAF